MYTKMIWKHFIDLANEIEIRQALVAHSFIKGPSPPASPVVEMKVDATTAIAEVCTEAVELAREFGTSVNFLFDGIEINAYAGCEPEKLEPQWRKDFDVVANRTEEV
jgi:hypothetical protein